MTARIVAVCLVVAALGGCAIKHPPGYTAERGLARAVRLLDSYEGLFVQQGDLGSAKLLETPLGVLKQYLATEQHDPQEAVVYLAGAEVYLDRFIHPGDPDYPHEIVIKETRRAIHLALMEQK